MKKTTLIFVSCLVILSVSTTVSASDSLFGDWGGTKTSMSEKGYDFNIGYKGDYVLNSKGGTKTDSGYLGNADVTLDLDLEKIFAAKGFSLFMYGLAIHGADPTDYVGDSFATSNIEAPDTIKLYEAFLKYRFNKSADILLGLRDLNADFYVTPTSGTLINSAFGISPSFSQTGVHGPSIFPHTSVATVLTAETESNLYFNVGFFNARAGDPNSNIGTHVYLKDEEGYLNVWEAGFLNTADENGAKKIGIGAWNYTKSTASLDPNQAQSTNWGMYGIIDHSFSKTFSAFFRHGIAAADVNVFKASTEVGFAAAGLFNLRPNDILALGYVTARASDIFQTLSNSAQFESVSEISYQFEMLPGASIMPDYQYVVNPGLSTVAEAAHVFSLRLKLQL